LQKVLENAKKRKVVEVHVDTKEYNEEAIKRVGIMFENYP